MALMEKRELIFIPTPSMGHVAQLVELAKLMISRENQLSITILVMKLPDYIDSVSGAFIQSVAAAAANQDRLHFFDLPPADPTPEWSSQARGHFVHMLVQSQKPHVKSFIEEKKIQSSSNSKIVGIVVDMLCPGMIDVADDFGIASYVFLTSGAAFLTLMLHFQHLQDEHNKDISEFKNSGHELIFPGFTDPVPSSVLPLVFVEKQRWLGRFLNFARGYRKARGILVNTFDELESYALNTLSSTAAVPPIYPVGPILNQAPRGSDKARDEIMKWLDEQPKKSVVFLCFGSQGSLDEVQVKELAYGIERSGFRFLWALRKRSQDNQVQYPGEYDDYKVVLPEGFLERTANVGKVVGWVPQLDVLSHQAVGGFVSHCGWNSTLESLWCGVPIATWPLHAEQQLNAFQLVRELKLAVDISLDYQEVRSDKPVLTAEEIERGLRRLMESDSETEVRKNVAKMREECRKSIMPGGSSYTNLGTLIEHMVSNLAPQVSK